MPRSMKLKAIPNHGRWGEVDNENDLDYYNRQDGNTVP